MLIKASAAPKNIRGFPARTGTDKLSSNCSQQIRREIFKASQTICEHQAFSKMQGFQSTKNALKLPSPIENWFHAHVS